MPPPEDRASRLLFVWLGLLFVNFELFLVFDWGQGPARVVLLAGLGALLVACRRWAPRFATVAPDAPAMTRVARALVVVGVLANVCPWLYFVVDVARKGELHSDQGQTVLDALHVLEGGKDPYASATVTDAFAYDLAVEALGGEPRCREDPGPTRFRVGEADPGVVPRLSARPECDGLRLLFASLGFKYGPAMLVFYAPFVAILGKVGFLASHLLLVAGCAWLLYRRALAACGAPFWAAVALAPLLWPTALAWNVLVMENLDILPVVLVTLAWVLWDREAYGAAAVCIGVSGAAKFLPALLFVPLLLRARARALSSGVALAVVVASFAPFAAWDPVGLAHNVLYPFTRPPDSTSLAFFLAPPLRTAVRALALAGAAALAARAHRRAWDAVSSLEYLVPAHLLLLASGTAFHNNYLVWLLPLVSLYLVEHLRRAGVRAEPGRPAATIGAGLVTGAWA